MEMDIHVIEDYFNTIQKLISKTEFFLILIDTIKEQLDIL